MNSLQKCKQFIYIFLTASAQEKDITKGKSLGADAYITKPFQVDELLKTIETLIE